MKQHMMTVIRLFLISLHLPSFVVGFVWQFIAMGFKTGQAGNSAMIRKVL